MVYFVPLDCLRSNLPVLWTGGAGSVRGVFVVVYFVMCCCILVCFGGRCVI